MTRIRTSNNVNATQSSKQKRPKPPSLPFEESRCVRLILKEPEKIIFVTLTIAITILLFLQGFVFERILSKEDGKKPEIVLQKLRNPILDAKHPVQFGKHPIHSTEHGREHKLFFSNQESYLRMRRIQEQANERLNRVPNFLPKVNLTTLKKVNESIPLVIMAFKRVDYLRILIQSIQNSDFPRDGSVPIVISCDGHVPAMMEYLQELTAENMEKRKNQNNSSNATANNNHTTTDDSPVILNIIQIFHPYSCYEHPHSFPGNDTSLNMGYKGDSYGNPRSEWATCCKHHFTWMLNTVFRETPALDPYDNFFFLEEDYVVSQTFYSSLQNGLFIIQEQDKMQRDTAASVNVSSGDEDYDVEKHFFGIVGTNPLLKKKTIMHGNGSFRWVSKLFRTGPMTLNRQMFSRISNHSVEYCTKYDDYNWDWTLFHLMADKFLPHAVLLPYSYQLVKHIGDLGMHTSEHVDTKNAKKKKYNETSNLQQFLLNAKWLPQIPSKSIGTKFVFPQKLVDNRYGGWFHPADMQHCLRLFGHETTLLLNNNQTWDDWYGDNASPSDSFPLWSPPVTLIVKGTNGNNEIIIPQNQSPLGSEAIRTLTERLIGLRH